MGLTDILELNTMVDDAIRNNGSEEKIFDAYSKFHLITSCSIVHRANIFIDKKEICYSTYYITRKKRAHITMHEVNRRC